MSSALALWGCVPQRHIYPRHTKKKKSVTLSKLCLPNMKLGMWGHEKYRIWEDGNKENMKLRTWNKVILKFEVGEFTASLREPSSWQANTLCNCKATRARRQSRFPTFISCQPQDANVLPKRRQSHQGDKPCDISTVPLVARWPVFLARWSDADGEPHCYMEWLLQIFPGTCTHTYMGA